MRRRSNGGSSLKGFRTADIVPLVVFTIFARAGVREPSRVLHIPINCMRNTLLERDLRFPAEFLLYLGAIERITTVMSRAILDIFNQGIGFAQLSENRANDLSDDGSHNAAILPAARWPALPPVGQQIPTASYRSNTSTAPGGYDVSRRFQRVNCPDRTEST